MNHEPRTIKVCVVSPLYHPSLGGLGRQAQLLTERLADEGVDVFVIARRMKGMPPAEFSPKVRVYRAWSIRPDVYYIPKVNLLNLLISLSFSVSCAFILFRKRHRYDIVHFHGASLPLIINLPMLKILGKKVIAKVAAAKLGTEAGSLKGRYLGLGSLLARLLRGVDAFIATTSEIEDGLLNDGIPGEKIKRITNFIDTGIFHPVDPEEKKRIKVSLGFDSDEVLVTFSGRFVRRKGIDYLLQAWKKIVGEFGSARLLLLGEGPLLEEMERMAEDLGITDKVVFYGHVNNVVDFLHATDIFVLPSLQEGMPNSLLEAMACGLPVVATRIGGVVDIIDDERDGILVEPGDSGGLAEGIARLLRENALADRIARNAYDKIRTMYSLDSIAPRYIELYNVLCRKPRHHHPKKSTTFWGPR